MALYIERESFLTLFVLNGLMISLGIFCKLSEQKHLKLVRNSRPVNGGESIMHLMYVRFLFQEIGYL